MMPNGQEQRRNVFVVHGRNILARDAMFEFLNSVDLRPLSWDEIRRKTGKPSPYVGEILDCGFRLAQAVIVLLTPDDESRLKVQFREPQDPPFESVLTGQPRQNVLFEAGMAMGSHKDRTLLVELGVVRHMSDIHGRHLIRLDNSIDKRTLLIDGLRNAGCDPNCEDIVWNYAGDFQSAIKVNSQTTTKAQSGIANLLIRLGQMSHALTYPQTFFDENIVRQHIAEFRKTLKAAGFDDTHSISECLVERRQPYRNDVPQYQVYLGKLQSAMKAISQSLTQEALRLNGRPTSEDTSITA